MDNRKNLHQSRISWFWKQVDSESELSQYQQDTLEQCKIYNCKIQSLIDFENTRKYNTSLLSTSMFLNISNRLWYKPSTVQCEINPALILKNIAQFTQIQFNPFKNEASIIKDTNLDLNSIPQAELAQQRVRFQHYYNLSKKAQLNHIWQQPIDDEMDAEQDKKEPLSQVSLQNEEKISQSGSSDKSVQESQNNQLRHDNKFKIKKRKRLFDKLQRLKVLMKSRNYSNKRAQKLLKMFNSTISKYKYRLDQINSYKDINWNKCGERMNKNLDSNEIKQFIDSNNLQI